MWSIRLCLALLALPVAANALLYANRRRVLRLAPGCDAEDEDAEGWLPSAAAFMRETLALAAAATLYPARWWPAREVRPTPSARRVVLVHGLGITRGGTAVLARRLRRAGYAVVSFSYPTRSLDVAAAAASLRSFIDAQAAAPAAPVCLVGCGVGGLVVRYAVRRYRVPSVRRIVTLACPHQGTLVTAPCGLAMNQLRPDSELIRHLNTADHTAEQFGAIAIHSEFDALVSPPDCAYYLGAFNVRVRGIGHFSFLFSRKILGLILENLEAES